MGVLQSLFHTNEAQLRPIRRIADRIEALDARFQSMDDAQLSDMTPALKRRRKKKI